MCSIVPRIPRFSCQPTRPIGVQRNRSPVRIQEALRSARKLRFVEPARRTPGLPLNMCEFNRVGSHLLRSIVHTHQPLVPEAPRLFEQRDGKPAARLIGRRQTRHGCNPFRTQRRQCIGDPCSPVVANHRKLFQSQHIGKIDSILRQRYRRTDPWRLLRQESGRTRAAEIRHHRPPALRLQLRGDKLPSARRFRPAMQQDHRSSVRGATLFKGDLQQLRLNCPHQDSLLD